MIRVAVIAPTNYSYYSRLVTYLAHQEPEVEVSLIVVRTIWSWQRIHGELRRDGLRLLNKVYKKLILGERDASHPSDETLFGMAQRVSLPGASLTDLSQQFSIPLYTTTDLNNAATVAALQAAAPDVILFTGGSLIRKAVLEIPTHGVLNCHAGLLPPYRGMDVIEWATLEAKFSPPPTGQTLHFMDRGVDTGPILLTRPIELRPSDSFENIRTRIMPRSVDLMLAGLRGLRDGSLTAKPQTTQEGKQYFIMHPRLQAKANEKLTDFSNRAAN